MTQVDGELLSRAYEMARAILLAQRTPDGHWVGELSASALSTATAVSALSLVQKADADHHPFDHLIAGGVAWLADHQNPDGGWGDTDRSFSNISTTMLCRSALHLTGSAASRADCLAHAEQWLSQRYGHAPQDWAEAVRARYGRDHTFSVPILMTAALAGLVSWREVPSLPFELACLPQAWFRFLRLRVVSYALPALIAIGQAVFHHRPPWNPLTRLVRRLAVGRSLRVLQSIQPAGGGFLEATPLTSFVTLGLVSSGQADHPVVGRCVEFLTRSVRPDGSWPIDTNLSTWVTTLAINALAAAGELRQLDRLAELRDWLLRQQYRDRHPYTGADPGGWAWTPLSGGVPDADDTAGAILALVNLTDALARPAPTGPAPADATAPILAPSTRRDSRSVARSRSVGLGIAAIHAHRWLIGLQNSDGGWPTFCRGWGQLPFDRSGADLTAHAIRALRAPWRHLTKLAGSKPGTEVAMQRGLAYLQAAQRPDGSWLPLWFGNQHAPDEGNPTYGTVRVLSAYRDLQLLDTEPARRSIAWLVASQNDDGGWGADRGTPSSVEETSLAIDALLDGGPELKAALGRGLDWLVRRIEDGGLAEPTPIGFYFAKLWYYERMYPIVFAVAALGRARKRFASAG
jgi:squalene-hopene/tetraprenyl-beta-curcumene cyclase